MISVSSTEHVVLIILLYLWERYEKSSTLYYLLGVILNVWRDCLDYHWNICCRILKQNDNWNKYMFNSMKILILVFWNNPYFVMLQATVHIFTKHHFVRGNLLSCLGLNFSKQHNKYYYLVVMFFKENHCGVLFLCRFCNIFWCLALLIALRKEKERSSRSG